MGTIVLMNMSSKLIQILTSCYFQQLGSSLMIFIQIVACSFADLTKQYLERKYLHTTS